MLMSYESVVSYRMLLHLLYKPAGMSEDFEESGRSERSYTRVTISQIFLRDIHVLPKLVSYDCRRDRWLSQV
jgi:hypothetical protein